MKKLLIVEDHADIRKLLRMTLEYDNFEVHEASNGDVGLAMARDMPGHLNGLDVCRHIKADPNMQHTKVIMLTARGKASDQEAGTQAGADAYLMKPFSTLLVLETIYRFEATT
jgi:two-component system, OmpR family, phosphate regulon response regulator PhoB